MDNKKKKRNKQKKNQNLTKNTEVLNTEEGKKRTIRSISHQKRRKRRKRIAGRTVPKEFQRTQWRRKRLSAARKQISRRAGTAAERIKRKSKRKGIPKKAAQKKVTQKKAVKRKHQKGRDSDRNSQRQDCG